MFLSKRTMWSESIREGNILCLVSHLERPGGRGSGAEGPLGTPAYASVPWDLFRSEPGSWDWWPLPTWTVGGAASLCIQPHGRCYLLLT